MKINFTKEQFKTLMGAVQIANWVVNSQREEALEDYAALTNFVFSHAKDFGLEEYVDDSEGELGTFYSTPAFSKAIPAFRWLADYEEVSFWDELAARLARREFEASHTKQEIEAMSDCEEIDVLAVLEDKYFDEFDEHGIDRFYFDSN